MTKNNPRIKDISELTVKDKKEIVKVIASAYFQVDEDEYGNEYKEYTPYFEEIGQVIGIAKYLIDGVEFELDDDVYSCVISDQEIYDKVNLILNPYGRGIDMSEFFDKWVMLQVRDVVEYEKQINIANIQNENNMVLTYKMLELIEKEREKVERESEVINGVEVWLAEQQKLNSLITPEMQENFVKNFNMNEMMDMIINKYSESELHKRNKEVIESNRKIREQENKIIDLQAALTNSKQKDSVKNVLSDKK